MPVLHTGIRHTSIHDIHVYVLQLPAHQEPFNFVDTFSKHDLLKRLIWLAFNLFRVLWSIQCQSIYLLIISMISS